MTDKSVNTANPRYSKLTIGVCPDQWGVWFPFDEKQVPWDIALAEMAEAGFSIMETGPQQTSRPKWIARPRPAVRPGCVRSSIPTRTRAARH